MGGPFMGYRNKYTTKSIVSKDSIERYAQLRRTVAWPVEIHNGRGFWISSANPNILILSSLVLKKLRNGISMVSNFRMVLNISEVWQTLLGSSHIREEYKNRATVDAFFKNAILNQGQIFSSLQYDFRATRQTL
jgi:hypothetical protein